MQFVKMDICKSTELQMKAEKLCLEGVEEFEKMVEVTERKNRQSRPAAHIIFHTILQFWRRTNDPNQNY
jgi:hypothetical protein